MNAALDINPSDALAPAAQPARPVLKLSNIAKTFGGARALAGVSFEVAPGEVHGLLGKNGSGKSTLVKILAGFHAPDRGGSMEFNGEPVSLPLGPGDFRRLGMSFVHQNLGLLPTLTVLENLRMSNLVTASGARIKWKAERQAALAALQRFGISLDPDERVDRISAVDRALLAIVRAFEEVRTACEHTGKPGLVLLDEPTPFLPQEGVAKLFELMRSIAALGSSVIFISHDIDEVMSITDRATVLRDGHLAGSIVTREATHDQMVELIIGRTLARSAPVRAETRSFETAITLSGLESPALKRTDLSIGRGEIVGLTGLIGSGYEELPYLAFGARPSTGGSVELAGQPAVPLSQLNPRRAIEMGFALLPGDRNGASGVGSLPIFENMFLPDLGRFFRAGRLDNGAMRRDAIRLGREFEVKPNDPEMKLSALSGGNAQKVLIARWMNRKPKLLLLDEPTQGVDVGTRAHIFAALKAAAAEGMSIVCASSDTEQLAEICDRVLVFARGRVHREITGEGITKDGLAEACYASVELDLHTANAPRETRAS